MSRMCSRRSMSPARSGSYSAEVPDEKQVLQVGRDRRQVLQGLDGLLAALRIARAQGRRQDLLEQRGLAVGRGTEDPQVAPADSEAGELGDRPDDLTVGVVVDRLAVE